MATLCTATVSAGRTMCMRRSQPKPSWPGEFMRDVKNGVDSRTTRSTAARARSAGSARRRTAGSTGRGTTPPVARLSNQRVLRAAPTSVPMATPRPSVEGEGDQRRAGACSRSRSCRSGHTGWRVFSEMPRSPRTKLPSQRRVLLTRRLLSRPSCSRKRCDVLGPDARRPDVAGVGGGLDGDEHQDAGDERRDRPEQPATRSGARGPPGACGYGDDRGCRARHPPHAGSLGRRTSRRCCRSRRAGCR